MSFVSVDAVPGGPDEPGGHPAPEREAAGGGGQVPAGAAAQARRRHHALQPAQAVEHHGAPGAPDEGRQHGMSPPPQPGRGRRRRRCVPVVERWEAHPGADEADPIRSQLFDLLKTQPNLIANGFVNF